MSTLTLDYEHVHLSKRTEDMLLKDYLPRSRIHLIPWIHVNVMIMGVLTVIWLFSIVVGFFDIDDSYFFKFGDPFVGGKQLTDDAAFAFILVALFVDGAVSRVGGSVFGQWKSDLITKPEYRSLPAALFLTWFDVALHWVRNTVSVIFLIAQAPFAAAMAFGDIAGHVYLSRHKIRCYQGFISEWDALRNRPSQGEEKDDADAADLATEKRKAGCWSFAWFVVFCIVQLLGIAILNVALWWIGFFKTDYFTMGPPIRVFSYEMVHDDEYWITVVYIFLDQIVSAALNAIFWPWLYGILFNNAAHGRQDYNLPDWQVYIFYCVYRIGTWARGLIILNYTFSQATFTAAFILGELTYATYHVVSRYQGDVEVVSRLGTAVALRGVQFVGYVIYGLSLPIYEFTGKDDSTAPEILRIGYFSVPPPFVVLGEVFRSGYLFWWFTAYSVTSHVITVMRSEIVVPYSSNVISGLDPMGVRYPAVPLYVIVVGNNLLDWIHTIISINFRISNFFISFYNLLGDLVVSMVIISRYVAHKHESTHIIESYAAQAKIRARFSQPPRSEDDTQSSGGSNGTRTRVKKNKIG